MSALLVADGLLRDAEEELRVLLEEDSETGEYLSPAAEPVSVAIAQIASARRALERARREQARANVGVSASSFKVVS